MVAQEKLLKEAWKAAQNAYAPYSRFCVGACIEMKDHTFVTGANVENASYGLTNCAERSALFAAYSLGYRKQDILQMAIVCDHPHLVMPCGACRQVMVELIEEDTPIYLSNGSMQKMTTIRELMPLSFSGKDLL
ncbi:MAG: cytidine deaminase [Erysipelotrichaceae bacterium]|jgi:cytidine deaminase|nr:cytidine deaminase [Erysipelotrichaceae bacterium]